MTIPKADVSYLNSRFLEGSGRLRLLPAAQWQSVPHLHLVQWCYERALYGIPTLELIEWLQGEIAGRKAIEIGSGNGDLGYHLKIKQTDSCIHEKWRAVYERLGQGHTQPRSDVLRFDAKGAVARLRPDVVIGSWITRRFVPGIDNAQSRAFADGVDEEALFAKVETYIVIGNTGVHGSKTLLSLPHQVLKFPWLVSRAINPEENAIYVWDKAP